MKQKQSYVIKIKYPDGRSSYVLKKYDRYAGRTLIVPFANQAQRFVSKRAAESWFDLVQRHWHNGNYELEAEALIGQ